MMAVCDSPRGGTAVSRCEIHIPPSTVPMNTLSRRPSATIRPKASSAASGRATQSYPCCPLAARPPRHDSSQQHPPTWEDLLGRR